MILTADLVRPKTTPDHLPWVPHPPPHRPTVERTASRRDLDGWVLELISRLLHRGQQRERLSDGKKWSSSGEADLVAQCARAVKSRGLRQITELPDEPIHPLPVNNGGSLSINCDPRWHFVTVFGLHDSTAEGIV
jgi:hypothetical protein